MPAKERCAERAKLAKAVTLAISDAHARSREYQHAKNRQESTEEITMVLEAARAVASQWTPTEVTSGSTAASRKEKLVETESQRTLFYVVKKPDGYLVWETTPSEAFERTKEDPTLKNRLDHAPFTTRAEAEQRCRELNAAQSKENS
jgi:hypothetical protein